MDQKKEEALLFMEGWNQELLKNLGEDPQIGARELMHRCAEYHYRDSKVELMLEPFIGNLEGFIEFLSREWGWIITYDEKERIITADENKDYCVCPMVNSLPERKVSTVLCHCSEGFGKRMFGKVIGKEVEAKVINSILRGDKSCIYQIRF